jgi:ribose transport system substrate-binding protein
MRTLVVGLAAACVGVAVSSAGVRAEDAGVAHGDTSKMAIVLANNSASDPWQIRLVDAWREVTAKAIKDGIIAKTQVTDADSSGPKQSAQIENYVVQRVNAITMNTTSPTAENGAIQEACDAGILVVSFDQAADIPCAYKISISFESYGATEAEFIAKTLNGKGNILLVHGLPGSAPDVGIIKGALDVFKKYPDIKVVGEVHGNWVNAVAQKEVAGILPTLPQVDAVIDEGGDCIGTIQAFKAAGRKIPIVPFGNYRDDLLLWKELDKQPGGYNSLSVTGDPGISQIAFWTTQQILAGKKVPKKLEVPLLVLDHKDLDRWLAVIPDGGIASASYTQEWTAQYIDAVVAGKPTPRAPLPVTP